MDFKSKVPMNTIGINKRVSRPSPIRVEVIVLNAKYFPFVFTFIFDKTIEFAKFPIKNEIKDANKIRGVLPKIFTNALCISGLPKDDLLREDDGLQNANTMKDDNRLQKNDIQIINLAFLNP